MNLMLISSGGLYGFLGRLCHRRVRAHLALSAEELA